MKQGKKQAKKVDTKQGKKQAKKAGDDEAINIFDRASQLGMQLDPAEFFRCALYCLDPDLVYGEWLKNHITAYPYGSEKRCDNVAKLISRSGSQQPWACIIEAQGYGDAEFHPRIMYYKIAVHVTIKHGPHGQDHYPVMTLILNLSDQPIAPCLEWLPPMVAATEPSSLYPNHPLPAPSAASGTQPSSGNPNQPPTAPAASGKQNTLGVQQLVGLSMRVWVINWRQVDGKQYLKEISAGKMGLCMLPWFPMTIGGGNAVLMKEWKRLALLEQDHNKRTQYAALALIFSEKGHCQDKWHPFLKGWNVEQSIIGNQWLEQGRKIGEKRGEKRGKKRGKAAGVLQQARASLRRALNVRFPNATTVEFDARITAQKNLDTLNHWLELAITAPTFPKFVAAVEANGNPK